MADIRIKDLTTTASSTASDDFIAVDGTTNGTRKLSAFSPTFGGNATVTGTLTVNSTSSFADRITLRKDVAGNVEQLIDNRNTAGGEVIYLSEDGLSTEYAYIARYNSAHATTSKRKALEFGVNGTGAFYNFASGVLKVSDTTASTTTTSGALVVSGGLGLAGNLNMGGSLSVAGSSGISVDTTGSASLRFNDGASTKWWIYKLSGDTNLYYRDMVNSRMQMVMVPGADSQSATTALYSKFAVDATTASTSTSSGALVVGNGTSGGLGVGGSIYAGDNINSVNPQGKIQIQGTGNTTGVKEINLLRSDGGDACTLGLTGSAYNGVFLAGGLGNNEAFIYNAAPFRVFIGTASTTRFDFTSSQFKINPTTASTSTSSGALVVSGGVGVAGAINCGSGLVANPLFTQTRKLEAQIPHTVSTEDYLRIGSNTGSTNTYAGEFGYGLTAGGSPQIRFNRVHAGTVTTWLTVPTSTGDAEFAGSVKTAAPSGGTAAAWKLGTVATVSPTSPNRTIEVDIGGTIYYIHAKTTNN